MTNVETLRTAVEQASEEWTGLDWDEPSTLRNIAHVLGGRKSARDLERMLNAYLEGRGDPITSSHDNDGSHASQQHRSDCRALERALEEGETNNLADLAQKADELAGEEEACVEARAASAAEQGTLAIEAAERDDWTEALACVERVCREERNYGDDPTWGPVRKMVEKMIADACCCDDETAEQGTLCQIHDWEATSICGAQRG